MSRKGENIYQRKDGRWEGRYVKSRGATGRLQYGYIYAMSYQEAKMKLARTIARNKTIDTNKYQGDDIPFLLAAEKWYATIEPLSKQSTLSKYRRILENHIYPNLGNIPLCKLKQGVLHDFCNQLLSNGGKNGDGLAPKTVADILSIVRNIIQHAIRDGHNVPCDGRSIKIRQKSESLYVLSHNDQQKLSSYLCTHLDDGNIGILISLFTGLRLGEVCALRWEDVCLENGTLRVRHTMQRIQNSDPKERKTIVTITSPKSACSMRTIPIPNHLAEILRQYKTVEEGYVMTNNSTHYIEPRSLQYKFQRVLSTCNIEMTNYHTLRHTFATRCVELGFDVKSLSEILGHSTVNITMNRYVHPSMKLKMENMQRLSVFFD